VPERRHVQLQLAIDELNRLSDGPPMSEIATVLEAIGLTEAEAFDVLSLFAADSAGMDGAAQAIGLSTLLHRLSVRAFALGVLWQKEADGP